MPKSRWSSGSGNSGRRRRRLGQDRFFVTPSKKTKQARYPSAELSDDRNEHPDVGPSLEPIFADHEFPVLDRDDDEDQDDPMLENAAFSDTPSSEPEQEVSASENISSGIPLRWEAVASILMSTGTTRFSEQNFDIFSVFSNWLDSEARMPTSRTVRRTLRPIAKRLAFVNTTIHVFPVDLSKSGAKPGVLAFQSKSTAPVAIVKPSDWAKMDVSAPSLPYYLQHISQGIHTNELQGDKAEVPYPLFSSIEDSPIVQNRFHALHGCRLHSDDDVLFFIRKGAFLKVVVNTTPSLLKACQESGFCPLPSTTNRPESIIVKVKSFSLCNTAQALLGSTAIRAGDMVVHIAPIEPSRFKRKSRDFLIFRSWIPPESGRGEHRVSIVFTSSNVSTIEEIVEHPDTIQFPVTEVHGVPTEPKAKDSPLLPVTSPEPTGQLQDGRKYTVYRFLLYADGFSPQAFKKGSMGGCYILPLAVSPDLRVTSTSVRRLGLTPPGVSTNQIIREVIEDIVQGTVEGFKSKDPTGEEVTIFLDCVGFIADYPAISEALDVLGHNSNAPCHLCFFTRYDRSGRGIGAYSYSHKIHSNHPSFSRFEDRAELLRQSDIDLKKLGMKDAIETDQSPLHLLSRRLEEVRPNVPKTIDGRKVVPSIFEPYKSCIIAPDHLFLGLAHNAISCFLKHVPLQVRRNAQILAIDALQHNGLFYQKELISLEKMEAFSMSISGMYAFLLVAPSAFHNAWTIHSSQAATSTNKRVVEKSLVLVRSLQTLVAKTQFVPDAAVDGVSAVLQYNSSRGQDRLLKLRSLAMNYVDQVSQLCRISPKAKESLDKPNIHRLLEFYTFTLPNFGNVKLIQELVLEKGHQELKRAYSKSNYRNAQLQAMEHAVANDWATRLSVQLFQVSEDGANWTEERYRVVLRLLGRPEALWLSLPNSLKETIRKCFPPPIHKTLIGKGKPLKVLGTSYQWKVSGEPDTVVTWGDTRRHSQDELKKLTPDDKATLPRFQESIDAAAFLQHMSSSNMRILGRPDTQVSIHRQAKCMKGFGKSNDDSECNSMLSVGDMVQTLSSEQTPHSPRNEFYLEEAPTELYDSKPIFWLVLSILQISFQLPNKAENTVHSLPPDWKYPIALVLPCLTQDENTLVRANSTANANALVRLQSSCRRILALHQCDEHCKISPPSVVHSMSPLEGGLYRVYDHSHGYPPRTG